MGKSRKKNLGSGKVRMIVEEQVLDPSKQNAEDKKHSNKRQFVSEFDTSTDDKKNKRLKRNKKLSEENANIDSVEYQLNDEQIEKEFKKSERKKKKKVKLSVITTGSSKVDGNDSPNESTSKSIEEVESSNSVAKQNKRKKNKKEDIQDNNEIDQNEIDPNKSKTQTIKNISGGKNKILMSTGNKKNKSNTIRFIDDSPVKVDSDKNKQKVNKKNMNDEEALVNDEEIDQFCSEIEEEDNAQYEDWVKLLEAKLGNNKK